MLRALERVDVRDSEVATSNHTGEVGQPKHAAQRELPHNDVVDYMDRESIGGCSTKVERMRPPSETLNYYISTQPPWWGSAPDLPRSSRHSARTPRSPFPYALGPARRSPSPP